MVRCLTPAATCLVGLRPLPALESERTESRFGFAMAEVGGELVPLPCSLLVAHQTESAKRPKSVWIVRRPKSQRRRRVAQFRRTLVDRPRSDDVAFFEQPVGSRHKIPGSGLAYLRARGQSAWRRRYRDPGFGLSSNQAVGSSQRYGDLEHRGRPFRQNDFKPVCRTW